MRFAFPILRGFVGALCSSQRSGWNLYHVSIVEGPEHIWRFLGRNKEGPRCTKTPSLTIGAACPSNGPIDVTVREGVAGTRRERRGSNIQRNMPAQVVSHLLLVSMVSRLVGNHGNTAIRGMDEIKIRCVPIGAGVVLSSKVRNLRDGVVIYLSCLCTYSD